MGDDELVVTLLESELDRTVSIAHRIMETLSATYIFGKKNISCISASIGIATFPDHAIDLDELFTAADNAMYIAKKSGKGKLLIYDSSIQDSN